MRPSCRFPLDCTGPRRGICRRCQPDSIKVQAEIMRKRCLEPAFIEARAEGIRAYNALFFKVLCEGTIKKRNYDSAAAFLKARAERIREGHTARLHSFGVLPGAEEVFRLARKKHFGREEAIQFANNSLRSGEAAE